MIESKILLHWFWVMLFECVKSLSACLWRFPFDFRDRRDDENIMFLPVNRPTSARHASAPFYRRIFDVFLVCGFLFSIDQPSPETERGRAKCNQNNPNCHRLCMRRFSSSIFMNLSNVTFNLLHLVIVIAILSSRHREDENDVYSLFPLLF